MIKKISFLLSFLVISLTSTAQITLHNVEGNSDINDGDIVTVNQDNIKTHITVTNHYNNSVNLQIKLVSAENTQGQALSMCFGVAGHGHCYSGVSVPSTFQGGAPLPAGATTAQADIDFQHIDSMDDANNTTYPKVYHFEISALNPLDNSVISTVSFTYLYDPIAQSINTFNKNDIYISTAHHHVLIVDSKYVAHITLYNLTGKKVKEVTLKPNQNHIYTGNMAKGIYILHVISNHKELYKKIIL
jgi:hypothetical protein